MNETSTHAMADRDFATHYEQLRGDALGKTSGGVGLTLFLRQGMVAWMQACSCVTPPPAKDAVPPASAVSPLPAGVRSQATMILAGIILNCRPEITLMPADPQKVNAEHLKRNAYLYVRQSTPRQVLENSESTKRQYRCANEPSRSAGMPIASS